MKKLLFFLLPPYLFSITIEGEIIGRPMKRGNYYLINIYNGTSTIGVFIDKLPKISHYGKYGAIGDKIRVEGKFNKACREHWGKPDIHATSIEVIEEGKKVEKPISKDRIFLVFILSLFAILLIIIHLRRNKKIDFI